MSPLTQTATAAYFYFYPLVENLRQVQRYVDTGVGSNPAAPFNSFSHARKLAGPEDTFVTINNDTVYSMAQLDLSGGPLRLDVPATGDRYYVLQFVDAWTNNIAYVGTRATGNAAGSFLIVPPGWDGESELPVIHASTDIVSIVGRFACTGPDDIPAVTALQDAVVLERVDPRRPLAGIPRTDVDATDAAGLFWAEARAWSTAFPAPEAETAHLRLFEPLWTDEAREALSSGHAAGVAKLEEATKSGHAPVFDGWTVGLHAFDYNSYALGLGTIDQPRWRIADEQERILVRAIACRLGLWGNHAYEAVYAQAFTDIDGAPLTGDSTYTIVIPSPPPVDAFWSITLYDIPNYYLVANPIDRYSLGDRTAGIEYADDGSLTITIARDEPTESVARSNWLPAPDAAFRLVFRLYTPGETILDGTWSYPQVRRLAADTIEA
ncbi:DUF1254 domain-containing protein [Agromyces silvae]|uniref:DUF1254 domain-containing protein n=1 Tax=Agromyces silvae TaxID=3388266 RepID=UPI00280AAFA9|nr:DUF1254 domain-containing protein [Agromyces protaetiae]